MRPLELTATPAPSPKFISTGSLKKFGTESNGISGGVGCWARGVAASRSSNTIDRRFMRCLLVPGSIPETLPPIMPPTRFRLPHPVVLLGAAVAMAAVLTWLLPAGEYDRRDDPATGRRIVVAGTYHRVDS